MAGCGAALTACRKNLPVWMVAHMPGLSPAVAGPAACLKGCAPRHPGPAQPCRQGCSPAPVLMPGSTLACLLGCLLQRLVVLQVRLPLAVRVQPSQGAPDLQSGAGNEEGLIDVLGVAARWKHMPDVALSLPLCCWAQSAAHAPLDFQSSAKGFRGAAVGNLPLQLSEAPVSPPPPVPAAPAGSRRWASPRRPPARQGRG